MTSPIGSNPPLPPHTFQPTSTKTNPYSQTLDDIEAAIRRGDRQGALNILSDFIRRDYTVLAQRAQMDQGLIPNPYGDFIKHIFQAQVQLQSGGNPQDIIDSLEQARKDLS